MRCSRGVLCGSPASATELPGHLARPHQLVYFQLRIIDCSLAQCCIIHMASAAPVYLLPLLRSCGCCSSAHRYARRCLPGTAPGLQELRGRRWGLARRGRNVRVRGRRCLRGKSGRCWDAGRRGGAGGEGGTGFGSAVRIGLWGWLMEVHSAGNGALEGHLHPSGRKPEDGAIVTEQARQFLESSSDLEDYLVAGAPPSR